MGQSLSPATINIKAELSRLYEKRLIVDELIRNLERYAACEVTVPVMAEAKTSAQLQFENIA